jgi:hypothetical protein
MGMPATMHAAKTLRSDILKVVRTAAFSPSMHIIQAAFFRDKRI